MNPHMIVSFARLLISKGIAFYIIARAVNKIPDTNFPAATKSKARLLCKNIILLKFSSNFAKLCY